MHRKSLHLLTLMDSDSSRDAYESEQRQECFRTVEALMYAS